MTDRPIIFAGPMIRALLNGSKSQTRRLAASPLARCRPGDRLWVRESWMPNLSQFGCDAVRPVQVPAEYRLPRHCHFHANWRGKPRTGWTPSIHMPRWASRMTLLVTNVRTEWLDSMRDRDAIAEGLTSVVHDRHTVWGIPDQDGMPGTEEGGWPIEQWSRDPTVAYRRLWNSLHPKLDEEDYRIVAVRFRVCEANIDTLPGPSAGQSAAA